MPHEENQPPKIDEDAWQKLGELPEEVKDFKVEDENKQAVKEDDPSTDKMTQLIKILAKHINSGEEVPE